MPFIYHLLCSVVQLVGVVTVSIAVDKRKLLEKFKHMYGVVHCRLYFLGVKLNFDFD